MRAALGHHYTSAEYVDTNDISADVPEPTRSETDSSIISSWNPLLSQLSSVMQLGFQRPLQPGDLGTVPMDAQKDYLYEKFTLALLEEKRLPEKDRAIWRVLYKTVGWPRIVMSIFLGYCGSLCVFAGPLLLKSITNQMLGVQQLSGGRTEMWILIALVFLVPTIGSICSTQSTLCFSYMGIQVRNIMTSVMFEKITSQRASALESGQITNLVNVDTKALEQIFPVLGTIVIVPGLLLVTLVLVYREIGPSTLLGLGYCGAIMPLSSYIISIVGRLFKQRMQVGDKRLKKISEIFSGIRAIKYFAWEEPFVMGVEQLRDQEQLLSRKTARLVSVAFYLQQSIPAILPVLIFSIYIKTGHELEVVQAFVVLQLIMLLIGPFAKLTSVGTTVSLALGSSARVSKFLFRDDMDIYVESVSDEVAKSTKCVISFSNASLGWCPATVISDTTIDVSSNNDVGLVDQKMNIGSSSSGSSSSSSSVASLEAKSKFVAVDKIDTGVDDGDIELIETVTPPTAAATTAATAIAANTPPPTIGSIDTSLDSASTSASASTSTSVAIETDNNALVKDPVIFHCGVQPASKSAELQGLNRGIHTLVNLNLQIQQGQLVAIVGPVGSGKSSLLCALLNELYLHRGTVCLTGSIAYHQQQSWIYNASMKQNILFGHEFNQQRFDAVIDASSLLPDIKTLPNGWDTEIGEKGINLSGGQKARISFSRALYSDADIYLLDDPLSAVDADVGNVMFYKGMKEMLKGKTILLATHQTQYLKDCDLVIVMDTGTIGTSIRAIGSYEDLLRQGIDTNAFGQLDNSNSLHENKSSVKKLSNPSKSDVSRSRHSSSSSKPSTSSTIADNHTTKISGSGAPGASGAPARVATASKESAESSSKQSALSTTPTGRLIKSEPKGKGSIQLDVYWYYISRGHPIIYFIMLLVSLGSQALSTYSNIWLSSWGSAAYSQHLPKAKNLYYLNIYTLLAVLGSFTQFINMNLNLEHRVKAAKVIHSELLEQVIYAPVSFFDTTPLGRIMNIFSNDIRSVDVMIGMSMGQLLSGIGQLCGNLGILSYTTKGTFLLILIPLFVLYSYFQKYFQKSNLELKRLDSIANSPIISQFSEILSGVASVRAYGARSRYELALEKSVVKESTIFYLLQMVDSWKQLRLDFIGALMSLFVYVLAASTTNFLPPKLLLVAITYSNNLPALCSNLVTIISNVESAFNSVERIMHYIRGITREDTLTLTNISNNNDGNNNDGNNNDGNHKDSTPASTITAASTSPAPNCEIIHPPSNWPHEGRIEFKDVVVGYRDGPPVLHGVNGIIKPLEKVGVVGRSGSGKSTLLVSLFRFENCRR